LLGANISDYFDRTEFYTRFARGDFGQVDAVLHQGACSDTMEHNGRYMLDTNYRCSKDLLDVCLAKRIPLLYASSAATYGNSTTFVPEPEFEQPLNVYGYSKLLFDNVVRRVLPSAQSPVTGFRYFNVYGPHEAHKGRMASVAFHHFNQFKEIGKVKLFGEYGGYGAGAQTRDFIHVDDVVKANLTFLKHPTSGIFNLGTGRAQPFNDVATSVVNTLRSLNHQAPLSLAELVAQNLIEYIPFPEALVGKYQCYTQADMSNMHHLCSTSITDNLSFTDVATGVARYVTWLNGQKNQT
jgi:ADP-L-glycero-D-manno-heptose 6-epimerase